MAAPGARTTTTKVAVFYPWVDVLERNGGASVRVGSLIDYLRDSGLHVTVVAPSPQLRQTRERVDYRWYQPSRTTETLKRVLYLAYRAILAALSLGRSLDEDFMLWSHLHPRLDLRFRRLVTEVVNESDAILLEYTFWGSPAATIGRKSGKRVVVTAYDVLAHQITRTPWLRKLTLHEEVRTLKAADQAVCVSADDQRIFGGHGVAATVVPHGIDTHRDERVQPKDASRRLVAERLGVEIPETTLCLFVGSPFAANFEAVATLRHLADASRHDDGEPFTVVIAGGCCAPDVSESFVSLGRVDDDILDLAYQLADVVLVPLTTGTGASLKTIDAMARGKVVLGTTVGLRGYAVTSGVNCIVSDDFGEYPQLIRDAASDRDARLTLEHNARAFAQAFDFRRVYRPYVELIQRHDRDP